MKSLQIIKDYEKKKKKNKPVAENGCVENLQKAVTQNQKCFFVVNKSGKWGRLRAFL